MVIKPVKIKRIFITSKSFEIQKIIQDPYEEIGDPQDKISLE